MESLNASCNAYESGTSAVLVYEDPKEHEVSSDFDIEYHYENKATKLPFGRVSKTVRRQYKPKNVPEEVNDNNSISAAEASNTAALPWHASSSTSTCDDKKHTLDMDVYSRIGSVVGRTVSRRGRNAPSTKLPVMSLKREELIHPSKLRSRSKTKDNIKMNPGKRESTVQEHILQLKRKQASWDNLSYCANEGRHFKLRKTSTSPPLGHNSHIYVSLADTSGRSTKSKSPPLSYGCNLYPAMPDRLTSTDSGHGSPWNAVDQDQNFCDTQFTSTPLSLSLCSETEKIDKLMFPCPDEFCQSETASVAPLNIFNQALMWRESDIQKVPETSVDNEIIGLSYNDSP